MKFYEEHREQRDRFEILAFHEPSVRTIEELDQRLEPVRLRHWQGKALPFPVLLDSTGVTIKNFGVFGYPTSLLIDPEGKLVTPGGLPLLREKLKETR